MNAPANGLGQLAEQNREIVEHLAQDLRAEVHRVPPDVAVLMRQAAVVCDSYVSLRTAVGDFADVAVRSVPIPPPED